MEEIDVEYNNDMDVIIIPITYFNSFMENTVMIKLCGRIY